MAKPKAKTQATEASGYVPTKIPGVLRLGSSYSRDPNYQSVSTLPVKPVRPAYKPILDPVTETSPRPQPGLPPAYNPFNQKNYPGDVEGMDHVQGYAKGGLVKGPGTATSDSIPAKLSKGEVVIPANVVKHFGLGMFKKMIAAVPPQLGAKTQVKKGVVNAAAGVVTDTSNIPGTRGFLKHQFADYDKLMVKLMVDSKPFEVSTGVIPTAKKWEGSSGVMPMATSAPINSGLIKDLPQSELTTKNSNAYPSLNKQTFIPAVYPENNAIPTGSAYGPQGTLIPPALNANSLQQPKAQPDSLVATAKPAIQTTPAATLKPTAPATVQAKPAPQTTPPPAMPDETGQEAAQTPISYGVNPKTGVQTLSGNNFSVSSTAKDMQGNGDPMQQIRSTMNDTSGRRPAAQVALRDYQKLGQTPVVNGEPTAMINGSLVYQKSGAPVNADDISNVRQLGARRESTPESRAELGKTLAREADPGFQQRLKEQAKIVDDRYAWVANKDKENKQQGYQDYLMGQIQHANARLASGDLGGKHAAANILANATSQLNAMQGNQQQANQFGQQMAYNRENAANLGAIEGSKQKQQMEIEKMKLGADAFGTRGGGYDPNTGQIAPGIVYSKKTGLDVGKGQQAQDEDIPEEEYQAPAVKLAAKQAYEYAKANPNEQLPARIKALVAAYLKNQNK
jgi:hypothetical protein